MPQAYLVQDYWVPTMISGAMPTLPFTFDGFHPPVKNAPELNKVQAGKLIQLEFSLGGDEGMNVIAEGYPATWQVKCEDLTPLDPTVPLETMVATGNNGLSYNPHNGEYEYSWQTDPAWEGACKAFVMDLVDGSRHVAFFQFK